MHSSFYKPFKSIFNSDNRQPVVINAGFADTSNNSIESGAIAAAGQESDAFDHGCRQPIINVES